MSWPQPSPVSRKLRYTVLTLMLAMLAFLVVVTIWAFSGSSVAH